MVGISRGAKPWDEVVNRVEEFDDVVVQGSTDKFAKKITKDKFKDVLAIDIAGISLMEGGTLASPTVLPAPSGTSGDKVYKAGTGFYSYGGNTFEAPAGKDWYLLDNGSSWSLKDMGALPQAPEPIANLETNSDIDPLAASQGLVLASAIGLPSIILDKNISECTEAFTFTGSVRNVIFKPTIVGGISEIKLWCVTPGDLFIGRYKIVGTTVYRIAWVAVTLIAGENIIKNFPVADGECFGILMNTTTYLARIGIKTETADYARYTLTSSVGTTPVALPAESNNQRFGVQIKQSNPSGLTSEVNKKVAKDSLDYELDEEGANIFSSMSIVSGTLINNSGAKQDVAGWKMAVIDVDPTKPFIGGKDFNSRPGMNSYYRFEDANGGLISFGGFVAGAKWGSKIPEGTAKFYVTVKDPSEADTVYANAFISYDALVNKVNNMKIASSKSDGTGTANQNLNTYDSVKFAGGEFDALKINGLPLGAVNAQSGEMYLESDGSGNYIVKVKGA